MISNSEFSAPTSIKLKPHPKRRIQVFLTNERNGWQQFKVPNACQIPKKVHVYWEEGVKTTLCVWSVCLYKNCSNTNWVIWLLSLSIFYVLPLTKVINNEMSQRGSYEKRRPPKHKLGKFGHKERAEVLLWNTWMQVWIPESMGIVLSVRIYNYTEMKSLKLSSYFRVCDPH